MTENKAAETFTCDACGGIFEKGWSEEEAVSEAMENFGTDLEHDLNMVLVCDDCYQAMKVLTSSDIAGR